LSDPFEQRPFPRAVLIGAAILITFVIAISAFVRTTGIGRTQLALDSETVEMTRLLRFEPIGDGTTAVYAVVGNTQVAVLDVNANGFILGVLRAMTRDRSLRGIPADAPYRVSRLKDGRLILEDPQTDVPPIDLRAFGVDNAAAFGALLVAESAAIDQ
jgi:putative photosynthetic complex assembly protein